MTSGSSAIAVMGLDASRLGRTRSLIYYTSQSVQQRQILKMTDPHVV